MSHSITMNGTTSTVEASQQQQLPRTTTTRIILGVTGSVAAVKAPEIALRLVQQQQQQQQEEDSSASVSTSSPCWAVKILLSRGGRHFWDQSKHYNGKLWEQFERLLMAESKKEEPLLSVLGKCKG